MRSTRPAPGLDDKVLARVERLFLHALADAAAAFRRADWKQVAIETGEFLLRELRDDRGRWYQSWQADGGMRRRVTALAADHAALIQAVVRLGEATGEARWIAAARRPPTRCSTGSGIRSRAGLYTTAEDAERLVVRQEGLVRQRHAVGELGRRQRPDASRRAHGRPAVRQLRRPRLQLLAPIGQAPGAPRTPARDVPPPAGLLELVIVGDDVDELVRVAQVCSPDLVMAWGEPYDSPLWEGRTPGHAYLCRDRVSSDRSR
ncbi:MAG: hypothetical protein R2697_05265 [Ilumatobacteraceae bacterium]